MRTMLTSGLWRSDWQVDPARYVNIHRAKPRLGLARARLGARLGSRDLRALHKKILLGLPLDPSLLLDSNQALA